MGRRAGSKRTAGALAVVALCVPLAARTAGAGPAQLPDLAPYAPYDIRIDDADGFYTMPPYALRFSTTIANRGTVPLDFIAENTDPQAQTADAAQCVRWLARKGCLERQNAGQFVYHADHGHYHINDIALYELRSLDATGAPLMTSEGFVAGGQKVSFCMQDTNSDDPGTLDVPNPVYFLCLMGVQGISPGYADTYDYGLAGQQIVLDGVPDGTYALVVTVDPTHKLFTVDRADDTAFTLIEISDGGAHVQEL